MKSVYFDEENRLVLSGRQDHEGQAESAVALRRQGRRRRLEGISTTEDGAGGHLCRFSDLLAAQGPLEQASVLP